MTVERRLRASRILKRASKVRELRGAAILASATRDEQTQRSALDGIEVAYLTVVVASGECLTGGQRVDTARYEMLSHLGAAIAQQRDVALHELQMATERRLANAAASVRARRHFEDVDKRVATLERTRWKAHATRMDEDAVDLWLKHREKP